MSDLAETIDYRGHKINVHYDPDAFDPRKEYDNVGTMACWHSRYNLGDEKPDRDAGDWRLELACTFDPGLDKRVAAIADREFSVHATGTTTEQIAEGRRLTGIEISKVLQKNLVILPLYLMDHSGLSMSTGAFNCPWDSGQVGWIYVGRDKMLEEWGGPGKRLTQGVRKKAISYLSGEVETYSQYLEGHVYGYVVEGPDGCDMEDGSCWGYYGYDHDKSGLLEQAKWSVDAEINHQRKKWLKRLAEMIRNHVPAAVRQEEFEEYAPLFAL